MKIPTLHVTEIEIPREVDKLYDLAFNLWWSWTPAASNLFAAIDPVKWALYRNPVQLLINIAPRQWYPLLEDESFMTLYHRVVRDFEAYLDKSARTWFHQVHGSENNGPIAYFSMEYGLHQSLAIYSGGLGVLSGDHCKSASDLGLPLVAVGLLYRHGYFQQTVNADGQQQHFYPEYDFTRLPLRPAANSTGRPVVVTLPLPGRDLKIQVWLAQVGRVPLLLLDTDLPENDPADRPITNQLYVSGRETRLLQELVLGMGGTRALRALGIDPEVWHLNEGHSVFLQLERWRELVQTAGFDPSKAHQTIRRNTVFTTHTPVPAGNEQFDAELVLKYLRGWCYDTKISPEELLQLGRAHDGDASFNLTALAIKTSSWANGVSKLNAEVASKMWRHLFPEMAADPQSQPIHPVTNGVHTLTWMGPELHTLLDRRLGYSWPDRLLSEQGWEAVHEIPDGEVWSAHMTHKKRLGRFSRSRLQEQLARHGASPDELRAVNTLFDPECLTVGFARRFATYKRAKLIFTDLERLHAILSHADRPIQILYAGKAHPADRPGQELIRYIFELSRGEQFAGKIFFLENYDMRMGRMLVQGVDVWLNTPRRPMEASGTSGQKAALNGALNFSILDGWWPEGFEHGKNGWAIGSVDELPDEAEQDRRDVESFYQVLGEEIAPLYYDRDEDGLPREWIRRMKESIALLTPRFAANRMVRDYALSAYLPAAERNKAGSREA